MGRLAVLIIALLAVRCATATCPVVGPGDLSGFETSPPGPYRIQAGDQLKIDVWQNESLSRAVRVRPDGQLSLPNLGEVPAAGFTVPELSKRLIDALKAYLPDPLVTISVEEWGPAEVFVLGKVQRPDAYPVARSQRVLNAIALAGGVRPGAAGCAVVMRQTDDRVLRRVVDLDALSRGEGSTNDVTLRAGDVITVH